MSQNSKDHLHDIPSRHVRVSRSIQVGGVEISKLEMSQLLSSSCHVEEWHWECIALDDTGWPGSWTWPRVLFPCLWSQQQFATQHFWKVSSWDFRFKGSAGFHVKSRFGLRFSQRSRQQTLRSTMFSPAKTLKILALSCIESWKDQRYWSKKSDGMLPQKTRAHNKSCVCPLQSTFFTDAFLASPGCYLQGYLAGVAVPALVQLRDQFGNNRTSSSPNLLFQVWQNLNRLQNKSLKKS